MAGACDVLVASTFIHLETFLRKAAALDIFEALIFNYKTKIGIADTLTIPFLNIALELVNQLQALTQQEQQKHQIFIESVQLTTAEIGKQISNTDEISSDVAGSDVQCSSQDSVSLSLDVTLHDGNEIETIGSRKAKCDSQIQTNSRKGNCGLSREAGTTRRRNVNRKSRRNCDSRKRNVTCKLKEGLERTEYSSTEGDVAKVKVEVVARSVESACKERQLETEDDDDSEDDSGIKDLGHLYLCDYCESAFTSWRHLSQHDCEKSGTKTERNEDDSNDSDFLDVKCSYCCVSFENRSLLNTHIIEEHGGKDDSGDDASMDGQEPSSELQPENLPFFCCQTCLAVHKTSDEFESHICKDTQPESEDNMSGPNVMSMKLITSIETLKTMRKFVCGTCREEYRSIARILYHIPRCQKGPYKCEMCLDEFPTRKQLNLHKKKSHRDDKCFFCDECGLNFKFRTSLQKHKVNRHETQQGPFRCEECHKKFSKKIYLTNHKIRMHRLEKKYLCQVCGNKFCTHGSLKSHLETHTDLRRFICTICHKQFRRKDKLKYHLRIHTGERPHLCQTCGKGFIRKSKLDDHMRRHRGEKRYRCNKCFKAYAGSWDLKLHTKKHHSDGCDTTVALTVLSSATLEPDDNPDDPEEKLPVQLDPPAIVTVTDAIHLAPAQIDDSDGTVTSVGVAGVATQYIHLAPQLTGPGASTALPVHIQVPQGISPMSVQVPVSAVSVSQGFELQPVTSQTVQGTPGLVFASSFDVVSAVNSVLY